MKRIDIYDGKYTVVMNESGTIDKVLRHGELWLYTPLLHYSSFVLALVHEIIELRTKTPNEDADYAGGYAEGYAAGIARHD